MLAASLEAVMIQKTNFACRLPVLWDPGGVWVPVIGSALLLRVKDRSEDVNQHLQPVGDVISGGYKPVAFWQETDGRDRP